MCLCLLCQQRDSDYPVFFYLSHSVPLFIMSTSKEDSDYPVFPSSSDCPVFCYLSLSVPLFIMPTKRLGLPCVLFFFISVCAVVYCTNKETQTAPYFVVHHCMCLCLLCQKRDSDCPEFCYLCLSVPLFIVPTKRLRLPCVLFFFISVCLCLSCQQRDLNHPLFCSLSQQRDSNCPLFCSSSQCVPLFIVPTKRFRLPCVLFFFISVC